MFVRLFPTSLSGAWLIELEPISDTRGFFARTFCEREFAAFGLETRFVQHSTSSSTAKGTLRGMHFQSDPCSEVKIVACQKGSIFDVIVDLRPASSSYRRWEGFELSARNRRRLYIPRGLAHGFQTLSADAEVGYLISEFFAPEAACGVRYDDPAFGIKWPVPVSSISNKDKRWPDYTAKRNVRR